MSHLLAAICFDVGQDVDVMFEKIATSELFKGKKVCGVLQTRGLSQGECHCSDMDLRVIGSEFLFRISQPLGQGSLGCRLNLGALAECSATLQSQVDSGCELLILNRFGKGESEGRGFRDLISYTVGKNIPVLTAIRSEYQSSFQEFSGDIGIKLPLNKFAIDEWFTDVAQAGVSSNLEKRFAKP